MTDKTGLPDDENTQNDVLESATKDPENTNGGDTEAHRQERFAAIFSHLMDGFGEACEQEGIEVAIAVAKHPESDSPIVFYRGHMVDAGTLMAAVLREIKTEVNNRLDTSSH